MPDMERQTYISALVVLVLVLMFKMAVASDYIVHATASAAGRPWSEYSENGRVNVSRLITLLKRSKTAKKVLRDAKVKANSEGRSLIEIIKLGKTSLIDTTLTRHFHPKNPLDVSYSTESTIYLNSGHRVEDALFDLIHELTHFAYKTPFNPYDEQFDVSGFIRSTIEGPGGELNAFLTECQVAAELFPDQKAGQKVCRQIQEMPERKSKKEHALKAFYRLGPVYYKQFVDYLRENGILEDFPNVSPGPAALISSAYGVPYPLAAVQEYEGIMTTVCKNDSKRLRLLKSSRGRTPASIRRAKNDTPPHRQLKTFENKIRKRCRAFSF